MRTVRGHTLMVRLLVGFSRYTPTKTRFDSNPTSVQFTFCGVGCFIALLLQWISNVDANYRERIGDQPGTIKNIVQYLFAAIITISFITMALTAILVLKDSSNIWLNITFIALLLSIFVAIISVWG